MQTSVHFVTLVPWWYYSVQANLCDFKFVPECDEFIAFFFFFLFYVFRQLCSSFKWEMKKLNGAWKSHSFQIPVLLISWCSPLTTTVIFRFLLKWRTGVIFLCKTFLAININLMLEEIKLHSLAMCIRSW